MRVDGVVVVMVGVWVCGLHIIAYFSEILLCAFLVTQRGIVVPQDTPLTHVYDCRDPEVKGVHTMLAEVPIRVRVIFDEVRVIQWACR